MQNPFQTVEKAKSIAEHISIIRDYQQTGLFDRPKALEIYKKFNLENADYCVLMNTTAVATISSRLPHPPIKIPFPNPSRHPIPFILTSAPDSSR